ncbi:WD40-repeat-containing domain protein [Usnea florida]
MRRILHLGLFQPGALLTSRFPVSHLIVNDDLCYTIVDFHADLATMIGSIQLNVESALNPITALEFLRIDVSQPYLLAGEGQSLKVFDIQKATLVHTKRIFDSQAIHGIACRPRPQGAGHDGVVLIWGGRSICLISIEIYSDRSQSSSIRVRESVPEILWDDWILDGCFRPANSADVGPTMNAVEAFLVTAHNKILLLDSSTGMAETEKTFELRCVGSGPTSILYSAHMLWADAGQRLLVAAGTVFGEVLFWSSACHHGMSPEVHLLYVFTGHEGSVFGVRISEVAQDGVVKRILASCSDDRTIRVWDISNTSSSDDQRLHNKERIKSEAGSSRGIHEVEATRCVATIMGHASRIWGLRFLSDEDGCWNFMSYGEDSTAQLWSVGPVLREDGPLPTPLDDIYQLSHKCTYAFHSGKNLWALAVFPEADGDCIIATGGADGRITTYKPRLHGGPARSAACTSHYTMDEISKTFAATLTGSSITKTGKVEQEKLDVFKTYTWIGENDFLTTTEHGNIWVGTHISTTETSNLDHSQNIRWKHVSQETNLISSSIATALPSLGIALLTGIDGTVTLYNHRSSDNHVVGKIAGKSGYLKAHALSEPWRLFAACLGSCQATVFMFPPEITVKGRSIEREAGFPSIEKFNLTLPLKFVVTSSCFLDTEPWIVLGSRGGDIAIYDLAHKMPSLALDVNPGYFRNIHGEDAITLVQSIPHDISNLSDRTAILTAGRDGKWALHHVFHKSSKTGLLVTLKTIHIGVPPFGPNIEGACIDPTSQNLVLWGFRSKQFIVWNETQKTQVMSVDCGGAHRNWAYSHRRNGSDGGTFIYTKASVCHVHSQTQASHQVIQHGGHGREIKAMALSPTLTSNDGSSLRLLATGAEDTTIRICRLDDVTLTCLTVLTTHTTGIQQLRWSPNGHLLFSAAGCEEFFVWRLRPAPLVDIGVICAARCPTVTGAADLRIMDFAIEEIPSDHQADDDDDDAAYEPDYLLTMIYSDSSIRVFHYHHTSAVTDQKFHLLKQASYTTNCLTQATYLPLQTNDPNNKTLCTASTDGHLAFWSLPLSSSSPTPHQPLPPSAGGIVGPIHHTTSPPLHASSIQTLSHTPLTPSSTLLITGGDDGAIALTRLRHSPSSSSPSRTEFETATLVLPRAHAGAVMGTVILEDEYNKNLDDSEWRDEGEEVRTYNVATVGNDQRLKTWRVSIDVEQCGVEGVRVWRGGDVYTGVADAGALGVYRDGEGGWVLVVVGIGVERWRVGR